jgi:hypothetical protein
MIHDEQCHVERSRTGFYYLSPRGHPRFSPGRGEKRQTKEEKYHAAAGESYVVRKFYVGWNR